MVWLMFRAHGDGRKRMTDNNTTKTGHTLCECGEGVHLHEAGYEVALHMCAVCRCAVADPDDFEVNIG